MKTNILAASLRDVLICLVFYGADVVTMPPKVFWKMYDHVLTREGLAIFDKDWAQVQEMMSELRKG